MQKKEVDYLFEVDGKKLPFSGARAAALEAINDDPEANNDEIVAKIEDIFGSYERQGASTVGMVKRVRQMHAKVVAAELQSHVREFDAAAWKAKAFTVYEKPDVTSGKTLKDAVAEVGKEPKVKKPKSADKAPKPTKAPKSADKAPKATEAPKSLDKSPEPQADVPQDAETMRQLQHCSVAKLTEAWSGRDSQKQVLSNALHGRKEFTPAMRKQIQAEMQGRPLCELPIIVAGVHSTAAAGVKKEEPAAATPTKTATKSKPEPAEKTAGKSKLKEPSADVKAKPASADTKKAPAAKPKAKPAAEGIDPTDLASADVAPKDNVVSISSAKKKPTQAAASKKKVK